MDPLAAETGEPTGSVNVTVVLREPKTSRNKIQSPASSTSSSTAAVTLGLCWDLAAGAALCADAKQYTPTADGVVTIPGISVPNWAAWSPTGKKTHIFAMPFYTKHDDQFTKTGSG